MKIDKEFYEDLQKTKNEIKWAIDENGCIKGSWKGIEYCPITAVYLRQNKTWPIWWPIIACAADNEFDKITDKIFQNKLIKARNKLLKLLGLK